jgi:hypothetical protein
MAEAITSLISDTEAQLVWPQYVVIYSPGGKGRKRFAENCVSVHASEAEALAAADPAKGYLAAVASGPSRSSEGFRLFYLLRWLD